MDTMMNPSGWLSVAEAQRRILSGIVPLHETVSVAVPEALMRVIAEDIIAPFNVPGHDNSAMDGFACRWEDIQSPPRTLPIIGTAFAGAPFAGGIAPGQCVKIMTGAQIPANADIVIPQEETQLEEVGNTVTILSGRGRRQHLNMRFAGEDLPAGAIALSTGQLCLPAEVGLLASLGLETVSVFRPLRVAFLSTGDEVRQVGETLGDSDVYDSNRHTLRAMIRRMGFEYLDLGVVGDDEAALTEAFDQAATADAVITSGGASVGEADYIRTVLRKRGEILFWKVAIRPGRPLAYGKLGTTDFFGLPGNPVSVMVCFYQFVRAALWKRAGRCGDLTLPVFPAQTTTALRKSAGRTEYQRGILRQGEDGVLRVTVTGDQGSGILSSMTKGNCFIVLPAEAGPVAAGEMVMVQTFDSVNS